MRALIVLLTAMALLCFGVGAATAGGSKLSLSSSAHTVVYGHTLVLSGKLAGGRAGERITIEAWPYPYGHSLPIPVESVLTGAGGTWRAEVRPVIETGFVAQSASGLVSPRLIATVKPLIAVRELGNGLISARVRAGISFAGRTVRLQQLQPSALWKTVGQKRLGPSSSAVFAAPALPGVLRAGMTAGEVAGGYLGTVGNPLLYLAT